MTIAITQLHTGHIIRTAVRQVTTARRCYNVCETEVVILDGGTITYPGSLTMHDELTRYYADVDNVGLDILDADTAMVVDGLLYLARPAVHGCQGCARIAGYPGQCTTYRPSCCGASRADGQDIIWEIAE